MEGEVDCHRPSHGMSAEHEAREAERGVQGGEEIEMLRRASKDGAFGASVTGQIDRERRVVGLQVPMGVVPVCRAVEGAMHQEHEPTAGRCRIGTWGQLVVHSSLANVDVGHLGLGVSAGVGDVAYRGWQVPDRVKGA